MDVGHTKLTQKIASKKAGARLAVHSIAMPDIPLAAVFSFLKETKGLVTWGPRDLAGTLNIRMTDADRILEILQLQDYAKPALERGQWMTTPAGETVSGASTPRFTLSFVMDALSKLSGSIKSFNKDRSKLFHINQAVAFGDFLKKPVRVQAADVGVDLVAKKGGEHMIGVDATSMLKEVRGGTHAFRLQIFEPWMLQRTHRRL